MRLVATALVVVELPTMRSVMFARVATRDEMKPLVVVELVVVRELAVSEFEERDVVVALVSTALDKVATK